MHAPLLHQILCGLLLALAIGCGDARDEALVPAAVSLGVAERDLGVYSVEGAPGPWWKPGGEKAAFDRDARTCVRESNAARAGATDPYDAAYRAFLACMERLEWTRRQRPPLPAAPAGS